MPSKPTQLANWQLPVGVSSGTWDYTHTDSIASDYDDYFRHHGMFRLDQEVVRRYISDKDWVIDLGCGTGRALLPLLELDLEIDGVAFDLSQPMLNTVRHKIAARQDTAKSSSRIHCIRGNLVDLSCFVDGGFDCAVSLFSTLGMIRGRESREQVFRHVARMLNREGTFIFQVHNYWASLFDPEGPFWMARNFVRARWKKDINVGDKFFCYRGIPDMYLHLFTKRELTDMLTKNAMEVVEWLPLNARQDGILAQPRIVESVRASGWIVVAKKT